MKAKAMGKVLYIFSHPIAVEWERVSRGDTPTERMYGAFELKNRGWSVQTSDARFQGVSAPLIRFFRRYGINLLNWRSIKEIRAVDLVVVKDDFSLMTTIVCKILGKKLIYLDSMFQIPYRWWKRFAVRASISLADRVVGYSTTQALRWANELRVPSSKFVTLPYTLDMSFYSYTPLGGTDNIGSPFVLAVGRDMGRDFSTLVRGAHLAGMKLTLVTLPYLLQGINCRNSEVEVRQNLAYSELFSLYSDAVCVVIPLHAGIDYPSGIRAMLEGLVLGRPVIATRTPALEEYVEGPDVLFVEPYDEEELANAIRKCSKLDWEEKLLLDVIAQKYRTIYDMDKFVAGFEAVVCDVIDGNG